VPKKKPAIVSRAGPSKKGAEASEDDQHNNKRQKKPRMNKKTMHFFDFNDESDGEIGSSP
jgi:hypothetical protein